MRKDRKAVILLLDGVGVGALPDARVYGDAGADTLAHVDASVGGLELPNLVALGLGRVASLRSGAGVEPGASFGKLAEVSAGKDSTTGHWELAGLRLEHPFPTYPGGFPAEVVDAFRDATGLDVLGNVAASGTEIIERLGPEHLATGSPILYTSADSVFQLAAHVDVLPLEELYRICRIARSLLEEPPHNVGRVIARPFEGKGGSFRRTPDRKDFSLEPLGPTILDALHEAGGTVETVGKVGSLFAYRGVSRSHETKSNPDGMARTLERVQEGAFHLLFTNLVDFDTLWGHRNDPAGFARGLEELDAWLPAFLAALEPGTLLVVTADHGNDPTHPGTDHTREYVPLLAAVVPRFGGGRDLGTRATFSDVARTLAEFFELEGGFPGESFLDELPAMA